MRHHRLPLCLCAFGLAAALPAQGDPLHACWRWVDAGQGSAPMLFADAFADAGGRDRLGQFVAQLAARAEQRDRPLASRQRAIQLLDSCSDEERYQQLGDGARAALAGALRRLLADTALPLPTRGRLLPALARMRGTDERTEWLLEGTVRLQNHRRFHGEHGSDRDAALLPWIVDYLAGLGGDASSALPAVRAVLTDGGSPIDLRRRCAVAAGAIAAGDPARAREVFVECTSLALAEPELVDDLLDSVQRLAGAGDLLVDGRCRQALLQLLDALAEAPLAAARKRLHFCSATAARHGDAALNGEVFARGVALLDTGPQYGAELGEVLRLTASAPCSALSDAVGARAFARLLEAQARAAEPRGLLSPRAIAVASVLRIAAEPLQQLADAELRQRALACGDALADDLRGSRYPALGLAAGAWRKARTAR